MVCLELLTTGVRNSSLFVWCFNVVYACICGRCEFLTNKVSLEFPVSRIKWYRRESEIVWTKTNKNRVFIVHSYLSLLLSFLNLMILMNICYTNTRKHVCIFGYCRERESARVTKTVLCDLMWDTIIGRVCEWMVLLLTDSMGPPATTTRKLKSAKIVYIPPLFPTTV